MLSKSRICIVPKRGSEKTKLVGCGDGMADCFFDVQPCRLESNLLARKTANTERNFTVLYYIIRACEKAAEFPEFLIT